jgi:tetratricopeptide (TPR) repeat protein
MLEAAHRLKDRRAEGMALVWLSLYQVGMHDFEQAEGTLREALAVGTEGFDDVGFAANVVLFEICQSLDRHAEAEALRPVLEAHAPKVDDPFWQAFWGLFRTLMPHWAGRFDEALGVLESWREAAKTSQQSYLSFGHQWVEALARGGRGEYPRALALLHDVITTAERSHDVIFLARALNTVGWVYNELLDHRRALEWNTRAVELAGKVGFPNPECECNARLNLADTLVELGRLAEAEEQYRWVEQVVRAPRPQDRFMLWRYAQHLCHSYGELWFRCGDHAQALAYANECLRRAEHSDSRKNIAKARRLRGQIFLARRELVEAEQELGIALQVAQAIGNPPQRWKTLVTLGELRHAQGRPQEAVQAYSEALAVIHGVAASLTDRVLRATFLDSPHVQHIRHLLREVAPQRTVQTVDLQRISA